MLVLAIFALVAVQFTSGALEFEPEDCSTCEEKYIKCLDSGIYNS